MDLKFEGLFNTLSLITLRIRNNAVVETKEDNERHTILIMSLELALAGSNNEEFEDFLGFLYYKNAEGNKVFDIDCVVAKEEKHPIADDFLNHKYKLELDKSVSVLLQDWFYNLKEIFYEKDKHKLFFDFLNKSITEKRFPLYKDKGKYQINDDLFTKEESKAQDVFYAMFKRNGDTMREIRDNLSRYTIVSTRGGITKIKDFKDNTATQRTRGYRQGGMTVAYSKIAHIVKENVIKPMYFCIHLKMPIESSNKKAKRIDDTLYLLNEIKRNQKDVWDVIELIKIFYREGNISKKTFETLKNQIQSDKENLFNVFIKWFCSTYKISPKYINKALDYVKDDRTEQIYKYCLEFDAKEYHKTYEKLPSKIIDTQEEK